jgi:lipopolysaccharide biosynthesis protein/tetratricopeptide (TPR) repeat protein
VTDSLVSRADAARDRGELEVAAALYRRYLDRHGGAFAIWVQLGHVLKDAGNPAAALAAYGRALGLRPKDPDLLLNLGHAHKLMGHRDEAVACYRRSYEIDGAQSAADELVALDAPVPAGFGIVPADASVASWPPLAAIGRLLRTPVLRSVLAQADAARDRRQWTEAAELYREYVEATPRAFAIWVQLGHSLKEAGRREEALSAYERALALDTGDADLLLNLGHLTKLLGRLNEAEGYYARSAAIDPAGPATGELRRLGANMACEEPGESPPHPVGFVDRVEGSVVVGWACDPRSMDAPARLEFVSGGAVVRTAEAHLDRPDVASFGFGRAPRGFRVDLSDILERAHDEIDVRIAGSTWRLERSPIRTPRPRTPSAPRQRRGGADKEPDPLQVLHASDWSLPAPPVRTIAFYLPQFHPFPENDAWWGRGFTEWTNVTRAAPQFAGHYQPHRPGELGFYDLRVPQVQHRQVELARRFGVSAFCFYFYWFSGRTLMESPLRRFADDPAIDFPFCLCWANENWTRRWDGLDSEQLIGQAHSAEDDLAFISHVADYMTHRNYLRVDGRPVLLVYRAELLPDAAATARRWRDFCRNSGVGDIYLVCTHAFTELDPHEVGFDAAVQFPPNNTHPREFETEIDFDPAFFGRTFDYADSVAKAESFEPPDYPLLRSAYPGWDNTARRGGEATIFVNSSPQLYGRYFESVARQTIAAHADLENRLVFVNAWNEWAEGAHLEPDERYGYAYLEATRVALARAAATPHLRIPRYGAPEARPPLAVIVHAYYLDILPEILSRCGSYEGQAHFVFTTPPSQSSQLEAMLEGFAHSYEILPVDNRGRDVAPFLQALAHIWERRFRYVLKLHTKKSTHRGDGGQWLQEFLGALADGRRLSAIIATLEHAPDIGLVGPASQVLPMNTYWGSNAARVQALARRLGVDDLDFRNRLFIAGTMFLARLEALEPLMALSLTSADFEIEEGQVDGTLAHALERLISVAADVAGFEVAGSEVGARGDVRLRSQAARDFAFAVPTLADA